MIGYELTSVQTYFIYFLEVYNRRSIEQTLNWGPGLTRNKFKFSLAYNKIVSTYPENTRSELQIRTFFEFIFGNNFQGQSQRNVNMPALAAYLL
jgi:hypothetical protein